MRFSQVGMSSFVLIFFRLKFELFVSWSDQRICRYLLCAAGFIRLWFVSCHSWFFGRDSESVFSKVVYKQVEGAAYESGSSWCRLCSTAIGVQHEPLDDDESLSLSQFLKCVQQRRICGRICCWDNAINDCVFLCVLMPRLTNPRERHGTLIRPPCTSQAFD